MRFEIGFTLENGEDDSMVIEGDSIEEIRRKAEAELAKRNAKDAYVRELLS